MFFSMVAHGKVTKYRVRSGQVRSSHVRKGQMRSSRVELEGSGKAVSFLSLAPFSSFLSSFHFAIPPSLISYILTFCLPSFLSPLLPVLYSLFSFHPSIPPSIHLSFFR